MLRKIPLIFFIGTFLISTSAMTVYFSNAVISAEQYRMIYMSIGLWFTLTFFLGVTTFTCVIIILMKGPSYVADAYYLPKAPKQIEANLVDDEIR